ncbi:Alpha/Beta hydrolase protein [Jackrogersella minutella]|nr:Alpha/Beta hydrolase protein [Jackrogersella minutella]
MTKINPITVLLSGFAAVATARKCQNITVPISLSALNTKFAIAAPTTNIAVTNFILNVTQPGVNYTQSVLTNSSSQFATVAGNYSIAATYCEPDAGPGTVLQVLTHGIGFDRRYWDFGAQNYSYSYVNAALARNYSTFAYDRLGIGQSSHGDPVNEIQTALELAALYGLTTKLRQAQVSGIAVDYSKVVHVGHSFGSIQSYALTAAHPEGVSDGLVLTGFGQAATNFQPYFLYGANWAMPSNTSGYAAGYMASGDVSAVQSNFFSPGNFDPVVLQAAYATGQPVAIGELMTLGSATVMNNTFGGPVMVITGDRDVVFCGGNCQATKPPIPAMSKQYFTNANNFQAVVVPGAGHGLNLEYSAPSTYTSILDFLDQNV